MRYDWLFVFLLDVDPNGVRWLTLRPVALGFAEVKVAHGEAFDAICQQMLTESAPLGVDPQRCDEALDLHFDDDP
jgi:hypothetical protein